MNIKNQCVNNGVMDKRKDTLRCPPPSYKSKLYFIHFIQYGDDGLCIAIEPNHAISINGHHNIQNRSFMSANT